ncbi:hypothetical protein EPVG_00125 [Emiliania huxleyi virus 201]|nr:hypothetical protein ELVG_00344 [Emiliania huxleyi virus 203]AEP15669.1 hypothetical protein EQVG_00260 [Emiliania huxleyi virus 207]AEP16098.1 hypothetical protein ERVG_00222 [Emiliania huxleyi virus 208]AET98013.1 hypothetical protein EPVG_00125 [Emiliania huxleyi virus 201]
MYLMYCVMILSICVTARSLGIFPQRRIGHGPINGAIYKGEHKFAFMFKETFELEITDNTSGILRMNGYVSHEDQNIQIKPLNQCEFVLECSRCTSEKLETFNVELEQAIYDYDMDAICLYIKPKNGKVQKTFMYRERHATY